MNLVYQQLELFPGAQNSRYVQAMDDDARACRTELQWQRSIFSYLDWRAGTSWRRISDPTQRNNPDRIWYLNGLRLISALLAGCDCARAAIALVPARTAVGLEAKTDDLRASKLCALPRMDIARMLMQLNPRMTNIKLICHFTKEKLARLVIEAQDRNAPEWRATA